MGVLIYALQNAENQHHSLCHIRCNLDEQNFQDEIQGPCSILQLHEWMKALANVPEFETAYNQFKAVTVWMVSLAWSDGLLFLTTLHLIISYSIHKGDAEHIAHHHKAEKTLCIES